ncbi:hypothetical protein KW797_04305 [Candidatus Parcubacteria bacterium]|nr:hypothetical protein [Candidatus Parcubacteria bacterium]
MNNIKIPVVIVVLLMGLVAVLERSTEAPRQISRAETRAEANVFANIEIEAKAAYVYDLVTGEMLYQKNESVPLPLASITKLMTAWLALTRAPADTAVVVRPESIRKEGDTGLRSGEIWNLKKLVEFTLTTSSNDGAHAIATAVGPFVSAGLTDEAGFVGAMNDEAKRLGLPGMYFLDPTGLDYGANAGAYGSAKEVALFLGKFLTRYPEVLEATSYKSIVISSFSIAHTAENTNKTADTIPGLLASKTGFTDVAGGNLAIAFDAAFMHPVVVVVLGSSQDGRFDDARRLAALAVTALK